MATTTQPFRLRPGTWADLPRAATLYSLAYDHDMLMDLLFPDRAKYPEEFRVAICRLLEVRYWTLGWRFTVAVDENDVPQGFTWWNRGKSFESFWKRWLSPTWWFAPIVRLYFKTRNLIFPLRLRINHFFAQVVGKETDKFLNTPRRRAAHYFSLVGVNPKFQGSGLGSMLIRDGLRDVDAAGAAAYLVRLKGLKEFYERFGFKEDGTVAVGDLAKWDGGQIMFRE
jgi:GNAT superfamily N-acetyltransferase